MEKDAFGIIYKITFPNGFMYVGQTVKSLEARFAAHVRDAYRKQINKKTGEEEYAVDFAMQRAIRKYGAENLKKEIIDYAYSEEELDKKEIYWIDKLQTFVGLKDSKGYNTALGGKRTTRLSIYTKEELKEFGEDFQRGMSASEMYKKYGKDGMVDKHTFFYIFNGKQWSEFTGIPKRDYSTYPKGGLTPQQVDTILEDFKECGDTVLIAKKFNAKTRVIRNIVQGKTWSGYTGITDNSFYEKYMRWSSLLTNQELIEIQNYVKRNGTITAKYLRDKYRLSESVSRSMANGEMLSQYTLIKHIPLEQRKIPVNAKITSEVVDKIIYEKRVNKKTNLLIAKELGINAGIVDRILLGRTWSEYTGITYVPPEKRLPSNTKLNIEEMKKLISDIDSKSFTWKELTQKYNIGESTARKYYNKYKNNDLLKCV